jgi:hypothetical protein
MSDSLERLYQAVIAARDLDPASPFGQAAVEALKTLGEGG